MCVCVPHVAAAAGVLRPKLWFIILCVVVAPPADIHVASDAMMCQGVKVCVCACRVLQQQQVLCIQSYGLYFVLLSLPKP